MWEESVVGIYVIKLALQETGVLPTPKNVGENEMYVEKGYPDVQNDVRRNVERKASRDAFPTPYQHGVEKASPDTELCVGIACIESTSFPMQTMPVHLPASGNPSFRLADGDGMATRDDDRTTTRDDGGTTTRDDGETMTRDDGETVSSSRLRPLFFPLFLSFFPLGFQFCKLQN
ncbi:hypothetical protein E5676_scaffold863G001020 [Cucumis melo var. makuwa]|uniref:Uncharacterized protein n=1 Tax=Cucumis melo var. makuwa TaxID=1194695 RepID=A0A5D3BW51_CUCMM|nr:hypothetical protein E5676_scaffold863G001020 [Cucumis melo var. makuwa]